MTVTLPQSQTPSDAANETIKFFGGAASSASARAVARTRRVRRFRARLPFYILFAAVALMGAFRERQTGGDVTWADNYASGMAEAKHSHQPILLSFRLPECGWCAKMDVETYTDPQVVALTRSFSCVRVESEIDPAVVARYRVLAFPTTILLDANGKPVVELPGYQPASVLLPALRSALTPVAQTRNR